MGLRDRLRSRLDSALGTPRPPTAAPAGLPQADGVSMQVVNQDGRGRLQRKIDALRNVITGMGAEDKVSASRPDVFQRPLDGSELTAAYRFNGYASRFISVIPDDATRKGWTVLDDQGKPIEGLEKEHDRLSVFSRVNEADTWGRLYGGAWILMVTEDDIPPEYRDKPQAWMAQPLQLDRVIRLQNLVVLDRYEAEPHTFCTDARNPNFRAPETYTVNPNVGGVMNHNATIRSGSIVHASRMLYFHGRRLPPQLRYVNNGVDDSILQTVWTQFRDKGTVNHALAAVANELKIAKLKMRDMADVGVSDEAEYFDTRMQQIAKHKSFLNMILLGADEDYVHEAGTVSGMRELDDVVQRSLQAVTGMPEQLWLGNAPGGLNTDGESHRNLWANVVSSYQIVKYQPQLVRLYAVMLAAGQGSFAGRDDVTQRTIQFYPLDELTEAGTASLRKTVAETDAIYVANGVLTPERIEQARFGADGWQMEIPAEKEEEFPPFDMAAITAALAGGDPQQLQLPMAIPGEADPSKDRARAIAAQMSEHAVEACPHGKTNRCPMCGIEAHRALEVDPATGEVQTNPENGTPTWSKEWRAIGDPAPAGAAAVDPNAPEAVAGAGAVPALGQSEPLNGAQIQAAQALLSSVALGQLPADAAQVLLESLVPADRAARLIAAMKSQDPSETAAALALETQAKTEDKPDA